VVELAKRKKYVKKITIFILLLIVIFIFSIKVYLQKASEPVNAGNSEDIVIEIPSGSSTNKIANILKENGLVKSEIVFKNIVRNKKLDGKLKAGKYTLNNGMNLEQIVYQLEAGGKNENIVYFTIPEGYEIKDIAERLDELKLIDKEVFLELTADASKFSDKFSFLKELPKEQSLEGFLFPDTYEVYVNVSEEEIIERMLSRFEQFYETDLKKEVEKSELDLNEIVTFASIVEKEARVDKERSTIAGVLYNRLNIDMLLQVDATVQYALGERKQRLLYKDLEVESPYNTYIHKGLPPAPIASPGGKSLIATVKPSDVDYLYYVLKKDGSGEHIFTKTYEEHLNAKSQK